MRDTSARPTRRPARAHVGQAMSEFVLIVAFIALITIPAMAFLRDGMAGMYVMHQQTLSAPVGGASASPSPTP